MKPTWIPDMVTHPYKNPGVVDFVMGQGYWMAHGNYSVQLYDVPASITDTNSFYKETIEYFKVYMIKDRAKLLPNLKLVNTKRLKVNGYPAYQAISVDRTNNPAGAIVATSIYMKNKLAVVSLLTPIKAEDKNIQKQIPWDHYNQFMHSLK